MRCHPPAYTFSQPGLFPASSPSTPTHLSTMEPTCPALYSVSSNHGSNQQHEVVDGATTLVASPASLTSGQVEEHSDYRMDENDLTIDNVQRPSARLHSAGHRHNLRSRDSIKRYFDDGKNEKYQPSKRCKTMPSSKPTKHNEKRAPIPATNARELPSAVLKRVRVGDKATYQLHRQHTSSRKVQRSLRAGKANKEKTSQPEGTVLDSDIYEVDCLLARWGRSSFLLKWADGTISWVERKDILDKQMIRDFEKAYQGIDTGVTVVGTRLTAGKNGQPGKSQYFLHWDGRPSGEDTWVDEKLLSPRLLKSICSLISACSMRR